MQSSRLGLYAELASLSLLEFSQSFSFLAAVLHAVRKEQGLVPGYISDPGRLSMTALKRR